MVWLVCIYWHHVHFMKVGDGWWFGRTESGAEGLFPASYVETEPAEPGTISSSSSRKEDDID